MSLWEMKGGVLVFRELAIENPHDIMERAGILHIIQEREHRKDQNEEYEPKFDEEGKEIFPLDVTFLSLIFLYDSLIITAGDDGYVSFINIFRYII